MLVVGEQTSRLRGTWLSLIEREITHVQQYVDNRASSHQSKERTLGNIFRMSKPSIDTASSGGKVSAVEKPLSQQDVNHGALQNISQLEDSLWAAADNLRANSKLTSSEYCMPVLGVIFLRHATNRYDAASRQIAAEQAAGNMPKRPLVKQDFIKRRALSFRKQPATTSC
jgi:hypothetical protein